METFLYKHRSIKDSNYTVFMGFPERYEFSLSSLGYLWLYKIIDEIDLLSKEPKFGIYLPIILVGSAGAGKSTFINIFNGCRISRASSSQNPITSKNAYYDVKIPGNDNGDADIDNEEAFIRFIDTPGFVLEKDIDRALKEIKNI